MKSRRYRYWSEKEVVLLKELYPKKRVSKLVNIFPGRSKKTVVAKALSLGVPSAKIWQSWENRILNRHFEERKRKELKKFLSKRSWSAILAQGERLGLRRKRRRPRLTVNEDYFKKWSSNMAYILGFILADGCIIEGTYDGYSDSLKFGVHYQDIDILEKIKQELESEHAISIVGSAVYFCIVSQKIVDDLKILGISYRKSLRAQVPKTPQEYERDFIRGVIDGDGSVSINKKGYPRLAVCGGEKIISFTRDHFFSRLDVYSKVSRRTRSKNSGLYLFEIAYQGSSAQVLLDYLYPSAKLYLDRKFKLAIQCLKKKMKFKKNYTQRENEIIRQFYSKGSKEKLLEILLPRQWPNIQRQAWKLGVYQRSKRQ